MTAEHSRLEEAQDQKVPWKKWGPYLSERQWGTVREDYSEGGDAWNYFSHDQARSRAYRWGEDGLAGISDDQQRLCFALTLWNGRDAILKERLFGLTGNQGNHGEDVKEYYFYLDLTPTHSYMRMLYKYPQSEFPYESLVEENGKRDKGDPEFELLDTGAFSGNRYFDIFVEYAKADVEDMLIRITAVNRGPEAATLQILPQLWFRNTWSWGKDLRRPVARKATGAPGSACVELQHWQYGKRWLLCAGQPQLLFTENETNNTRLFGGKNRSPYVKDAFHEYVIQGNKAAVNPEQMGTKVAPHYLLELNPGQLVTLKLRLTDMEPLSGMDRDSGKVGIITSPGHAERAEGVPGTNDFDAGFDGLFVARQKEAEEFYAARIPKELSDDAKAVMRQSFAGMLWSKQCYHYDVQAWLEGDPAGPPPPPERWNGRNRDWMHLYNDDIVSMPDKWEYPWWAAWRVYKIDRRVRGTADRAFLEKVFHKLLLNFTWWVNRKDPDGANIFQGGFLGLDNIGVFDRSAPLPTGGHLEQSDGTSWMGMYCLNMLAIALELAKEDPAYEDV